ncbi:hypothetical protein GTW51_14910 [Aurantimonas aggregata]|uniref:Uncharacterized protein n=1 Tax=Aurantimonas aggregata TaxID=2047720 RepID=A0A6L9MJJ4_9HYPH|nr:hypothetical protein [Aurantimonas aggregata]NDV87993.1 hypothetical protein [Aurantimonas aggregata]
MRSKNRQSPAAARAIVDADNDEAALKAAKQAAKWERSSFSIARNDSRIFPIDQTDFPDIIPSSMVAQFVG